MNLVMDCYLTGACEMAKRLLHGDSAPEPFDTDYDHIDHLKDILKEEV